MGLGSEHVMERTSRWFTEIRERDRKEGERMMIYYAKYCVVYADVPS